MLLTRFLPVQCLIHKVSCHGLKVYCYQIRRSNTTACQILNQTQQIDLKNSTCVPNIATRRKLVTEYNSKDNIHRSEDVDPEEYALMYTNSMKKKLTYAPHLAIFSLCGSLTMSLYQACCTALVMEWSNYHLFHYMNLYAFACAFSLAALFASFHLEKTSMRLKSVYKHRQSDDFLAVQYRRPFSNTTEKFHFTLDDCIVKQNVIFNIGNVYINNELCHMIPDDFVVMEYYNMFMKYELTSMDRKQGRKRNRFQ